MRMNECAPLPSPRLPTHPLQLPCSPLPFLPSPTDCLPACPSVSRPLLTPGFAGLCYDCGRCVLHTYLLAPLLRRDAHIKDCHFQRSGVSPPHKCCPDTWSGKIKTARLPRSCPVSVCLEWVWLPWQVSRMSFPFSPPPLLFPLLAPLLLGNKDTQLV